MPFSSRSRSWARRPSTWRTSALDATQFLAETQHEGVTRVEADLDRCAELGEKSLAIGTALAPRIGYDNAVAIARTAYREGRTIRDVAMELSGLGPEEIAHRLGDSASAASLQAYGGYPKGDELSGFSIREQ